MGDAFDGIAYRLRLVRRAKRAKDASGLPTDLTPAELDALGIPSVECRRTRDRLGHPTRERRFRWRR